MAKLTVYERDKRGLKLTRYENNVRRRPKKREKLDKATETPDSTVIALSERRRLQE